MTKYKLTMTKNLLSHEVARGEIKSEIKNLCVSIRNTENGNTHKIYCRCWQDAEKIFLEATRRKLASAIIYKYEYLAQNQRHKDFEFEYCYQEKSIKEIKNKCATD